MKLFRLVYVFCIVSFALCNTTLFGFSTLNKNDPYPLYSTLDPYGYILTGAKNKFRDENIDERSYFYFSISPFFQHSKIGRTYDNVKANLGDLEGKWNILGMVYGGVPTGETLVGSQLGLAKTTMFGTTNGTTNLVACNGTTAVQTDHVKPEDALVKASAILSDATQQMGYVSAPLKYQKSGARFEAHFQPLDYFGFSLSGGFVEIKQASTGLTDKTLSSADATTAGLTTFVDPVATNIKTYLTDAKPLNQILVEQGIDASDFHKTSAEDLRASAWISHMFHVNHDSKEYAPFLFIPFLSIEGTAALAQKQDRTKAFALPFGNDGHSSVGFTAGLNLDFYEMIEFGFRGGMTHFFDQTVKNYRLPNAQLGSSSSTALGSDYYLQTGVFPFSTTVKRKPGRNMHLQASFNAYRFSDYFSCHAQYTMVSHDEDSLTVTGVNTFHDGRGTGDCPDKKAFYPKQAERLSKFKSHLLNAAINLEISSNLNLGVSAQWPISQRNAYKTITYMATLSGLF